MKEWKACYSRYPDLNFDRHGNRRATDQRTVAERKWRARTMAALPQQPCDHGIFSDDHLQSDLVTLARKDT